MKRLLKTLIFRTGDIILSPFVLISAIVLKKVRNRLRKLPVVKKTLLSVGVFPIIDHYYDPLFNPKHLQRSSDIERSLHIDWNIQEQLSMLNSFNYQREFDVIPDNFVNITEFYFNNGAFESGDAEYWYNIIRYKKPKKIIEIGSGQSTKMAQLAIKANQKTDSSYQCKHICIEPYEMPWLERIGVEVIRKKVEEIGVEFFQQLDENDILFIDSSHIIRPQGDVLFEYLELLPSLKKGVIVHIHDIFSPREYPRQWLVDRVLFWNEQYLLEAFLMSNNNWKIIGALNFLKHNYFEQLKEKCPKLTTEREPASFYIIHSTHYH
jgi:uncharacterized UPF0146 family protein